MRLWIEWFRCVSYLRDACTRRKTFPWMVIALLGFSTRSDLAGVTSFVRAGFLRGVLYRRLLHLFHSSALCLDRLTHLWVKLALKLFTPLEYQGHLLLVADGLKAAKEGRKMPAVKKLHQSSTNNSKPPFIMGHSLQALGLLVQSIGFQVLSVPLVSRIHEGLIWSTLHRKSLLEKLVGLLTPIQEALTKKIILVADAFYASRKIILPLLTGGHHLVTRVKTNCVGYRPAPIPARKQRGRPRTYGEKLRLRDLWGQLDTFVSASSPVYGESQVEIHYLVVDLLWRPVGRLVRFVLVLHPHRGRIILMTTMTSMPPLEVLRIYGHRFKIEVGFRAAIHTIGAYAYHFWMKTMIPIGRNSGDQFLHRKSKAYRRKVRRKMNAYHRYIQLACISQGILQYLGISFRKLVWGRFASWMRTMKTKDAPSEAVVAQALRSTLPEFLMGRPEDHELQKILSQKVDPQRIPEMRLSA